MGALVGALSLLAGGPAYAEESTESPDPAKVTPTITKATLDQAKWHVVYDRSGKTVRIGQYMGIGGGVAVVAGAGTVIASLLTSRNTSYEYLDWYGRYIGVPMMVLGAVSYTTGPSLVAGGSVRQNKALRKIHPTASKPTLGYTSWAFWGLWRVLFFVPEMGILSDIPAYIFGSMQYRRNKAYWDANAQTSLGHSPPRLTVRVTPIEIEGHRGLALVGTF